MYKILINLLVLVEIEALTLRVNWLLAKAEADPENAPAIWARVRGLVDTRLPKLQSRLIH